jgi:signal transduction histidine kinase
VTGGGLTIVNPASAGEPHGPVQARIEGALVDGLAVDVDARPSRLSPGVSALQIKYTAFHFAAPETVRFRYRLDGFDANWVAAGTKRDAFYMNLPPRDYRFRVAAGDAERGWTGSEAVWAFTIAPHFYQTWWFAASAAVAVAGIFILVWQGRAHQVRRRFAIVLAERVRLSREIHDTLLQSLVGVSLQFEAVARMLEPASPARERLIDLRNQVEAYIREARQSIWNLRSPTLQTHDLEAALRDAGARAVAGSSIALAVDVSGEPRRESLDVDEQLLRVGQEAILNAVRHAYPRRIAVDLRYERESIVLRVSDDGRGLDPIAAERDPAGHYGLLGLKERAERVGGSCSIEAVEGRGTLVQVVVPRRRTSRHDAGGDTPGTLHSQ